MITEKIITFKQLRDRSYNIENDKYGLCDFLTEHFIEALIKCPNNLNDDKPAVYLMLDDGVVIGRTIQFGTNVMIDNNVVHSSTGGSLLVDEKYRKNHTAGVDLMLAAYREKGYDIGISSLFTQMVIPMHEAMRGKIFEMSQYIKIISFEPFVRIYINNKFLSKIATSLLNNVSNLIDVKLRVKYHALSKKFDVIQKSTVPEWTEEMTLNDGHKYKEVHDVKWLQWNLECNFNGNPEDKQTFFAIYKKGTDIPIGFFMTKERLEKNVGIYKELVRGTLVEWASVDESLLSEFDINVLALFSYSKKVSRANTVTVNSVTESKLKHAFYVRKGVLHFCVKDKKKQFADIGNAELWRLRYGSCNTILY